MAKLMTVEEALEQISAKKTNSKGEKILNRFNKKNFNILMTAMANDPSFVAKVAKVKNGELDSVEEVMVSKGFREFVKRMVEKCGVDKKESEIVLSPSFIFETKDVDGLYEFFTSVIYEYMNVGNKFDFMPRDDFNATLKIKDVKEEVKVGDAYSPKDKCVVGKFETTKKAHKELSVKSTCPTFLKSRKPV